MQHSALLAPCCVGIAELEGAAAIAAQQVRADEVIIRYDGKLAPSEDKVQTRIDAINGAAEHTNNEGCVGAGVATCRR